MRRPDSKRALAAVAGGLLLIGTAACNNTRDQRQPTLDDSPLEEVTARVNANSAAIDFLLEAKGRVTGEWNRPDGKQYTFDVNGILFYRPPRRLYLQLKHTFEAAMEIGSNDEEWWVWMQGGDPSYRWARHEDEADFMDVDVPLRPDHFAELLGLGGLPPTTVGLTAPLFRVEAEVYELLFHRLGPLGTPQLVRAVRVSRRPPYLMQSVVHYDADGHVVMYAELSRHELIPGTSAWAPRHIEMHWPKTGSRLELDFTSMARSDNKLVEPKRIERSPRQRGVSGLGVVERVGGS